MANKKNKARGLRATAAAAAITLTLWPAFAANLFASGEQARELCQGSRDWCVGFVTGALDGWAALEGYYAGEKFCLPDDITTGEIVEVFLLHLDQQPERLKEPAAYILYEKLIELFRCGTSAP